MALLNKLFSAKGGSAFGGKKSKPFAEHVETPKSLEPGKKVAEFKSGGILISPITAEKALSGQSLNQYTFKVASSSNKIEIAKEINKTYGVLAVSVNIINIPKKAIRVGRTLGFKAGYKKAVVTLAKGQSIELK
ncbi:MAG: 50S ribosomal protein L23 [Patescibacteria group bacterium]|mgnify:FL=1